MVTRDPGSRGSHSNEIHPRRIDQSVEDKPTFPARGEHPCLTQSHQMLGEISLTHSQNRLQMAHTGFPSADRQQDLDPGRLAQSPEQLGEQGRRFSLCHIQNPEYILSKIPQLNK